MDDLTRVSSKKSNCFLFWGEKGERREGKGLHLALVENLQPKLTLLLFGSYYLVHLNR